MAYGGEIKRYDVLVNTSDTRISMDLPTEASASMAPCLHCGEQGLADEGFEWGSMLNFSYPGEPKIIPAWEMSLKIASTAIVFLVALFGNLTVVSTVIRNKRMWTTTNFYIVNLAVSDLMVTLTCTWVHLVDDMTENWVLGAFFCKFNTFAQGKKTPSHATM